jgi:hypothetical protein
MILVLLKADYGPFAPLVAASGCVLAMGAALLFGFKGRARWEPNEIDVPSGPQKVASLVACVSVALIWFNFNNTASALVLTRITIYAMAFTVGSLLVYGSLKGFVFERIYRVGKGTNWKTTKVIGGLWLLSQVRELRRNSHVSIQDIFASYEYDKDYVWSRPSQQLASLLFVVGYLGLTVCGAVTLGSVGILISLKM